MTALLDSLSVQAAGLVVSMLLEVFARYKIPVSLILNQHGFLGYNMMMVGIIAIHRLTSLSIQGTRVSGSLARFKQEPTFLFIRCYRWPQVSQPL